MNEKFKPGEAIVRFRGDMKADNAVMRDPVLFRIIDEKHYTVGDKYRIWPSYDMAVAIEDSIDGVTHAFRSKEFELRKELIDAILDALGMRKPYQGFFSRLEFKGRCSEQDKVLFTSNSVINLFIVYELNTCLKDLNTEFTLKDCLPGNVKTT